MATPSQSQSPTNSAAPQRQVHPPYTPPKSPEEVLREQKRINVLLEINALILQHISQLQGEGQGGAVGAQGADPANPQKVASQEYIICLRTIQANISWLAAAASSNPSSARSYAGPALMESPLDNAQLLQKYEELRRLFPNWRGSVNARQLAQGAQASSQNHPQGQPQSQPQGHS